VAIRRVKKSNGASKYLGRNKAEEIKELPQHLVEKVLFHFFPDEIQKFRDKYFHNKKWYNIGNELRKHIKLHANCFLNDNLLAALYVCESKEWHYFKYNFVYQWSEKYEELPPAAFGLKHDLVDEITEKLKSRLTPFSWISLTNDKSEVQVPFVPMYFLCKWQLNCSIQALKKGRDSNEYDKLINKGMKCSNTWIEIDAGALKQRAYNTSIYSSMNLPKSYRLHPLGENSCIITSLINAMHYINDIKARDILVGNISKSLSHDEYGQHANTRRGFCAVVMNDEVMGYITKTLHHFDILKNRSMWPRICVLKGSDEGINHAVTVVEDYIFDGNTHVALPLMKENLDWCCACDGSPDVKFVNLFHAYRFIKTNPSSQFLLRGKDKIKHAYETALQCWTSIGNFPILERLRHVENKIIETTDIIGTVRDMMKSKPFSYRPITINDVEDIMTYGANTCPVIALLNGVHSFYHTVICAYGNVLFHGDLRCICPRKIFRQFVLVVAMTPLFKSR